MSQLRTRGGVRKQSISAVVTRADGRVEDLGVIALYHRNPFVWLAWKVGRLVRRILS